MQDDHTLSEPAYQFPGFYTPRFTQVPDDFFDELLPHLTGAELKVALYIIRRTYGFKKDSDDISLSQLVSGITTRDGRALDHGTGLGRQSVVRALKGLISKGVVVAVRNQTPFEGDLPTTYTLHQRGESHFETGGSSILAPRRVPKSHPQDTVQETESKRQGSRHVDRHHGVSLEDRETIAEYVDDMRRQLGDGSGQARALGQVLSLYARSGVSLERFLVEVYDARKAAQAKVGADNRWAYWYKVLEDRLKGGQE